MLVMASHCLISIVHIFLEDPASLEPTALIAANKLAIQRMEWYGQAVGVCSELMSKQVL